MYEITIEAKTDDGRVISNGQEYIVAGNANLYIGGTAWTDGKIVYGNVLSGSQPALEDDITGGYLWLETNFSKFQQRVLLINKSLSNVTELLVVKGISISTLIAGEKGAYAVINQDVYNLFTGKKIGELPGVYFSDYCVGLNGELLSVTNGYTSEKTDGFEYTQDISNLKIADAALPERRGATQADESHNYNYTFKEFASEGTDISLKIYKNLKASSEISMKKHLLETEKDMLSSCQEDGFSVGPTLSYNTASSSNEIIHRDGSAYYKISAGFKKVAVVNKGHERIKVAQYSGHSGTTDDGILKCSHTSSFEGSYFLRDIDIDFNEINHREGYVNPPPEATADIKPEHYKFWDYELVSSSPYEHMTFSDTDLNGQYGGQPIKEHTPKYPKIKFGELCGTIVPWVLVELKFYESWLFGSEVDINGHYYYNNYWWYWHLSCIYGYVPVIGASPMLAFAKDEKASIEKEKTSTIINRARDFINQLAVEEGITLTPLTNTIAEEKEIDIDDYHIALDYYKIAANDKTQEANIEGIGYKFKLYEETIKDVIKVNKKNAMISNKYGKGNFVVLDEKGTKILVDSDVTTNNYRLGYINNPNRIKNNLKSILKN